MCSFYLGFAELLRSVHLFISLPKFEKSLTIISSNICPLLSTLLLGLQLTVYNCSFDIVPQVPKNLQYLSSCITSIALS